jgi:hypothetical protein
VLDRGSNTRRTKRARTDSARPPSVDRFANFIAEASARFTVPARWIRAIIQIESAGDEHAISPRGAMGLRNSCLPLGLSSAFAMNSVSTRLTRETT